ncbi:hypothetical protein [Kocuria sp. KH4]
MGDRTQTRTVGTVYAVVLGALIALFVGLGVSTVHPGPREPQAAPELVAAQEVRELTAEEQQQWAGHLRDREVWEERFLRHSRDVGLMVLVVAVVLLGLGLLVGRRGPVLGDGILLGGLFTLLHSVVRSLISQDTLVGFGVVTASLVAVLFLGYRRFVDRPTGSGGTAGPVGAVVGRNGKDAAHR